MCSVPGLDWVESSLTPPLYRKTPRLKQRGHMENDERRYQESRDEYERQMRHWGCRARSGGVGGEKSRAERPEADGDDKVQYPKHLPGYEGFASGKVRLADEGDKQPW